MASDRPADGTAHGIVWVALARFLGGSIPLLVVGLVLVKASSNPELGPAFALLGWVFIGLAALMLLMSLPYMVIGGLYWGISTVVGWYND